MPRSADGKAVHGGGEDQPHGLHLGVAVHRLRYLCEEGDYRPDPRLSVGKENLGGNLARPLLALQGNPVVLPFGSVGQVAGKPHRAAGVRRVRERAAGMHVNFALRGWRELSVEKELYWSLTSDTLTTGL